MRFDDYSYQLNEFLMNDISMCVMHFRVKQAHARVVYHYSEKASTGYGGTNTSLFTLVFANFI